MILDEMIKTHIEMIINDYKKEKIIPYKEDLEVILLMIELRDKLQNNQLKTILESVSNEEQSNY